MNLRRVLRLTCLTAASFFWASCGDDSSSQSSAPDPEIPEPDSSAGASNDNKLSSAAGETATSSESSENLSSTEANEESSSSETVAMSSETQDISSSSVAGYVLAKDSSVTCEEEKYRDAACCSTKDLTCDDYKRYLASDTTISEKLLSEWEDKLKSCGAIQEPVTLYGVMFGLSTPAFNEKVAMKCSNDSTYKDFLLDGNKVYTSTEEYNEAHGISSSSGAEESSSSSEEEDLVRNCPQSDFETFVDMLPEVRKALYDIFTDESYCAKYIYTEANAISEAGKEYIASLLDHDNKTIKGGRLSPFFIGDVPEDGSEDYLAGKALNNTTWFSGYVAKTETCSDGAPVTRKKYESLFSWVLTEAIDNIVDKAKTIE